MELLTLSTLGPMTSLLPLELLSALHVNDRHSSFSEGPSSTVVLQTLDRSMSGLAAVLMQFPTRRSLHHLTQAELALCPPDLSSWTLDCTLGCTSGEIAKLHHCHTL